MPINDRHIIASPNVASCLIFALFVIARLHSRATLTNLIEFVTFNLIKALKLSANSLLPHGRAPFYPNNL